MPVSWGVRQRLLEVEVCNRRHPLTGKGWVIFTTCIVHYQLHNVSDKKSHYGQEDRGNY